MPSTTPSLVTQRILSTHPQLLLAVLPSAAVVAAGRPGESGIVNGLPAIRLLRLVLHLPPHPQDLVQLSNVTSVLSRSERNPV